MVVSNTDIYKWVIYRMVSPSNRVYIGITSDLKKRMSTYKSNATSKQTLVYNSMKKYGFDNHVVDIIDTFEGTLRYANGKEIFWIRTYMSNRNKYPEQKGLNLTNGGDGMKGYKMSKESIEKSRQSKIGKKASDETKRRMSESRKGKKMNFTHLTPEFKAKLSENARKYKHTDEAKKKISEASKGNKYAVGRKMTAEQIEHRSSLIRGTKIKKEVVEKRIATKIEKYGKPVYQYNLNGEFLKKFPCITIASREIGIPTLGMRRNLKGQYKQSRGFIFKYE